MFDWLWKDMWEICEVWVSLYCEIVVLYSKNMVNCVRFFWMDLLDVYL